MGIRNRTFYDPQPQMPPLSYQPIHHEYNPNDSLQDIFMRPWKDNEARRQFQQTQIDRYNADAIAWNQRQSAMGKSKRAQLMGNSYISQPYYYPPNMMKGSGNYGRTQF